MKILYVATVVKTHIIEFHIPYLKMIKDLGWETAVAARNDFDNPDDCKIPFCDKYFDIPFERNPFKIGNIKAYKKLKKIIDEGNYDIIHCHTPVGAMITRLASRNARKRGSKVFYTAHGFHFYSGAPILNWIAYYPVERLLARYTDVLITITKEDYNRALKFKAGCVEYIPGIGIDIKKFKEKNCDKILQLKNELSLPKDATIVLSVGEVNSNKNHRLVLETLPSFPNIYYILCGRGPLLDEHRRFSEQLNVSDRFITTGYRNDVEDFYGLADYFVFPSFREGLPVALMEAMASNLVCIASKNRGTDDLLYGSRLLFNPKKADDLAEKMKLAFDTDCSDEIERNAIHLNDFDLKNTLNLVKGFYMRSVDIERTDS